MERITSRSAGSIDAMCAALSVELIGSRAYANVLTGLIPDLYAGLNVVSREMTGFITSANRESTAERAAVGQSVRYSIAGAQAAVDIVPSMNIPEPADQNITPGQIQITKSRSVAFGFTGEEQVALDHGPGYDNIRADIIAEAVRTLANEIEADLSREAAMNASRAYGSGGTTPFGSGDLADLAQLQKILDDNGAPPARSAVLNTSAAAKLQTIGNVSKVNEAGDYMTLRQGELIDLYGFSVKKTGQPVRHTKGNVSGASARNIGHAVGETEIELNSAGTGAILAGDVIKFAGDEHWYVVASGNSNVATGGTIRLAAPGLQIPLATTSVGITVANSYAANVAFSRDALALAARLPALPNGKDAALDRMLLIDPRSGLTFEVAVYEGYRMVRFEVAMAWGVKAIKPAHIGMLLG